MKIVTAFALLLTFTLLPLQASEKKPIIPAKAAKPVGPYSPGIFAGDYLYVAGQGARDADGRMPPDFESQVKQCMENIRGIVETAGLSMQHVVYTQVYLADMSNYDVMNRVYSAYFKDPLPARATLGVARMPTDTPVEINAVAVRDLSHKKAISAGPKPPAPVSPGILTADRLYISGMPGVDTRGRVPESPQDQVKLALDHMGAVLTAAGLDFRHVVFVNPYLTEKMPLDVMNKIYADHFEFGNTPARATIKVSDLPVNSNIMFTGVAVRNLAQRRAVRPKNMVPSPTASPCVFAGDSLFCSAKAGFIPGPNTGIYAETVENQVRQTMRNLLDGLEEAGLTFADVVATNVYLDNIEDFAKMNRIYGLFFPSAPPARTTVQPLPPGERKPDANGRWPRLEEISVIAVK